MTDDEWQKLHDGLDSASLLAAVDTVDLLSVELGEGDGGQLSDIRDGLQRLHRLSLSVSANASPDMVDDLFELADDLEDQVGHILATVERLYSTLEAVMALYPRGASNDMEGLH